MYIKYNIPWLTNARKRTRQRTLQAFDAIVLIFFRVLAKMKFGKRSKYGCPNVMLGIYREAFVMTCEIRFSY